MFVRRAFGLVMLLALGCAPPPAPERARSVSPPIHSAVASVSVVPSPSPSPLVAEVIAPPKPAAVSVTEAERVLFLGQTPADVTTACGAVTPDEERIRCLIGRRYDGDQVAVKLALDLYARSGDVAGLQKPEMFDGGYRGMIELVPELPTGKFRQHLAWVEEGTRDFDTVYSALKGHYRWRALTLRFFRSVKRTTPNGFARDWSYAYNVSGSLLHSATAVRELMVHEIFHLNDETHGDWSSKTLAKIQAEVIKKCGKSTTCLAPYAPNDTIVKGGTYYAFHADNGPWEYAAELAVRHFNEQRTALRKEKVQKPFKCGPAPNGTAWKLFVDEFWSGVDLVPPCP